MNIEVRNRRFAGEVPKYWLGGRRAVSAYFDGLSVFFPAGERFFMDSVLAYEALVANPTLRENVKAFVAQEGLHTREHARYNARLRAHGYPVEAMDRRVVNLLALARVLPARVQLGFTCALEHFTSALGQMLLEDPSVLEAADEMMAALWLWHSVEEVEHRSVAFDVFEAAGGTYLERACTMLITSVVFWAKVLEHQVRMMKANGTLSSSREWRDLATYLVVRPGALVRLVPKYLAYFRPSFHPSEAESEHLIAKYGATEVSP